MISDQKRVISCDLSRRIAKLPPRHVGFAGRLLGSFAYWVDIRHRRIVNRNLQFIYPGWSRDRVNKTARRVFQHLATTALEILQVSFFIREDILRKTRIEGDENLRDAIHSQKGIIFITAHIGNWEMGSLYVACRYGHPVTAIVRKLSPATFDRWIYRMRTRFGSIILDKKKALPKMARVLRKGGSLGILIDQETIRSEGIEAYFFGKKIMATPGAALLARRYDCVVLPAYCVRDPEGLLVFRVKKPLVLQQTDDSQADLRVNTQRMITSIENMIKGYPDQWLWAHKRWKRFYPYLYPEDMKKRKYRRAQRHRLIDKKDHGTASKV